jgi:hypothetical protein
MNLDLATSELCNKLDLVTKRSEAYESYFNSIRPKTERDGFRRGLFALASVHTTWELNCDLFAQLWDLEWLGDMDALRKRIVDSRAGLVNGRVKAFSQYAAIFWQFPGILTKKRDESWYEFADRIEAQFYGLGPAKSAFLVELLYFHDNRNVCVDTHMLQLYGIPASEVGNVRGADLVRIETHWDCTCKTMNVNPVTARWILWDEKQSQTSPRYWSKVLEGQNPGKPLPSAQMTFEL